MANRSVVPDILNVLEPWLEAREAEWKKRGTPTLPLTKDGKVNVRAITHALGLKESQECGPACKWDPVSGVIGV